MLCILQRSSFPSRLYVCYSGGAAFALDQEGPTPPEDFANSRSVTALRFVIPGSRASPADLTAASVHVICSGPRGPSFTNGHCDVGFCRSTPPCDSRKPNSISKHCCVNGTGCPLFSGPGKPSSSKRHRNIKQVAFAACSFAFLSQTSLFLSSSRN